MSKTLKAVLLSAFIFPGTGHFSLRKPVQGVLLSVVAVICLYFLITTSIEIAQQLSLQIQNGEIPMDVEIISETVSQRLAGGDGQRINIPSLILVTCWIAGIVDSFRIGWMQDKLDKSKGSPDSKV